MKTADGGDHDLPQATQLVVGDVDDVFLPSPSDLLANLSNCREQVPPHHH